MIQSYTVTTLMLVESQKTIIRGSCTNPHICTETSTSCLYESTPPPHPISYHGLQRCRKVTASFISSGEIITDSVLPLLTETFPHRQALKIITPTRGLGDCLHPLGWLGRSYLPMSLKHSYYIYIVILGWSNLVRNWEANADMSFLHVSYISSLYYLQYSSGSGVLP